MNRSLLSILWILSVFAMLPAALAQQDGWPRTLSLEEGTVTIYSPQVDKMDGDVIHYRAALAYRSTPDAAPVFGAGWFESRVDVDQVQRIVRTKSLQVTDTRFPGDAGDIQANLALALAEQSPGWNLDFSLDELQAALKTAESESEALQALDTTPPKIVYRDHPALLISIDGEPVQREIENSPYKAVINTPYPLITDGKTYYLNAAKDVWYRADKVIGPYRFDVNPPADITAMVTLDETDDADEVAAEPVTAATAPEVVVSMEPAELLVTEGPADFVPLVDDLLVLKNSQDDVFMHVSSQRYYIVLAGRWYYARSLYGPWSYQAADALPLAFAQIPDDSDQADTRVYIAGTEEASEAVLDAYVPQTAAVARGEADIEVAYDGEPSFKPVDGADLGYAENTGSTVLQSDRLYYLVEDGVWYVSTSPNGPWQVSDYRPDEVETILPSSPVYNVRYVYVYDSTPEVVYVGYTPGYTGSYVYRNTIVYGTGWYYRPWVTPRYYYPRYSTWGFNVRYDPWYGWGFGMSWSWGPFSFGYYPGGYWHHNHYWHHRHYGHWGPSGYRHRYPRYGHNDYRRGRYGHDDYGHGRDRYDYNDYGHDRDRRGRDHGGYSSERSTNLYSDRAQRARVVDTRDRSTRPRSGRDDTARQVNNTGSNRSRGVTQIGDKKVGRSRISPVTRTDLAMKARIRDADLDQRQRKPSADTRDKAYRGTGRDLSRSGAGNSAGKKTGGERNRITPVSRTGNEQLAGLDIRPVNGTGSRGSKGLDQLGDKKVGRSRLSPVKATDLAMKARVRDANLDMRQRELSANDKRTVYRSPDQSRQRPSTGNPVSKKAGGERNRITPVSRTGNQQSASPEIRSVASAHSRRLQDRTGTATKPEQRSAVPRQPQDRASENSSQQRRSTAARQVQSRASGNISQQRRSVPAKPPSSRANISQTRQQPRKLVAAPVQQPQPRGSRSPQNTKQVASVPSRPPKSQNKTSDRKSSSKHSRSNRDARR